MDGKDKSLGETREMLALVGEAISEWSFVELSLCNLFTICVTPTSSHPDDDAQAVVYIDFQVPTAIFYSVENFRSKLRMVDAALEARISGSDERSVELRTDWAALSKKTRKLSLKRNRLAHWTVTPAYYDDGISNPAKLMPPYGSPGWWSETGSNPPGKHMSSKEVNDIVLAFSELDEKLRSFYKGLASERVLTDDFDRRTIRLIKLHERRSHRRAENLRQELGRSE